MSSQSSEMHPINYVIAGAIIAGAGYTFGGGIGGFLIFIGGFMFFGGLGMLIKMLIRMLIT